MEFLIVWCKLNIVHVNRSISEDEAFQASSIYNASAVVILSRDHQDPLSDGTSFELVDRLRQNGF